MLLALTLPATSWAIVDIHDRYYAAPKGGGLTSFGVELSGATGDKDELNLGLENHTVFRRKNGNTFLLVGEIAREELNDVRTDDTAFAHLRYARHNGSAHGFEVFAQYEEDVFASLTSRELIGGGYRYEWKPGSDNERGLAGVGLFHETEEYTITSVVRKTTRINSYVTLATPVNEAGTASVALTAYAQPAVDDFSDIRAIAVLTLNVAITENVDFRVTYDYQYDGSPETGLASSNGEFSTGIFYTFK